MLLDMGDTVLLGLLAAAAATAVALALLALRHGRRMRAAERAVVELARSWSEDGTSRGRVCSAARSVAGARHAFIAELSRRGDRLRVTAVDGDPLLLGYEAPLDANHSLLARAVVAGAPVHVPRRAGFPEHLQDLIRRTDIASAHVHPVVRGDLVLGVLAIGWAEETPGLSPHRLELIVALAEEAGRAIERDAHVALLDRQARTDELTALPNRRAWDEAVEREMARARRTGEPLCLALVDLDHFKAFNDRHGHQAGDRHLRRTAAAWRRELRTVDVLARYGGEEFGVLLPSCDLERAREVLDRVRAATPDGETASAGVVHYDGRETSDALLARADAALYQAKDAGRATTVLA
jgi:diguanylate cyclase (GGDEF)-like protein